MYDQDGKLIPDQLFVIAAWLSRQLVHHIGNCLKTNHQHVPYQLNRTVTSKCKAACLDQGILGLHTVFVTFRSRGIEAILPLPRIAHGWQ